MAQPPSGPPGYGQPHQPYPEPSGYGQSGRPQPEPQGYPQPGQNYPAQQYPAQQPAQQHPGQQPQQPVSQSQLVVNLRKPFGLLADQMVTPSVRINGHQATARWGQNFYPTHAGQHQIDCSSSYMWQFGPQSMTVDIPPGQSVEVHYSGPVVTFGSGKMGYEVQPRPGMVAWILIISIPVGILLLLVLVGIIGALTS